MPDSTGTLSRDSIINATPSHAGWSAIWNIPLVERSVGLVLTVIAIYLNWFNFINAGGLWRDEVNSLNLALLPDMSKFWSALQFDSFPVLHYFAIRGWASLLGSNDTSMRLLGLTVGVLLILAIWYKSLSLGGRAPIISLLLIGLNPVMIRFLDAIRPNGLAALATVIAFTVVWRMLKQADMKHLLVATIILVICAHILFQSAIFVLAIGLSAILTGFLQWGLRRAALLSMPFVIAALSLIPYSGNLQKIATWAPVAMSPPDSRDLLKGLLQVVNGPAAWTGGLWLVLLLAALGSMIYGMRRAAFRSEKDADRFSLNLYCGLTMVLSTALYMLFLTRWFGTSPKSWHYIPLLVPLAISSEQLIERWFDHFYWRAILFLLVTVTFLTTFYPSLHQLQARFTSMDLVAEGITREARPNDLVVLMPWFYGVSFSRYYHGSAPWMSFPALTDNSIHRFDLLKEKMLEPEKVAGDLEAVMTTLKRGGKVWVVGSRIVGEPVSGISLLPPAPLPQSGWSSTPYLSNWRKYLMFSLATHAIKSENLYVNDPQMLMPQEAPAIAVYSGYKE